MIDLLLGRREVGKTTLALALVSRKHVRKRVLFDPRQLLPAAIRARTPVEIRRAFVQLAADDITEIAITPEAVQPCFDATAREVRQWFDRRGPHIGWLIDELRFIEDTHGHDFDWILRCTTVAQATIVMTAHRPADVPTDIRAIADVWCLFRMAQEHDLKVVDERCGPKVARIVAQLKPREFVSWDDRSATFHTYTDPKRWYVPLRAPSVGEALTAAETLPDPDDDAPIDTLW